MQKVLWGLVAFAVGVAVGLGLVGSQEKEVDKNAKSLRTEISSKDQEISSLKVEIAKLRDQLVTSQPTSASAQVQVERAKRSVKSSTDTASGDNALSSDAASSWRANRTVEEIKDLIAVSDNEQSRLLNRLNELARSTFQENLEYDKARNKIIDEELGSERAEDFRRKEQEREQQEFNKKIDDEVIVLSKRLSLGAEQEASVRQALVQAENMVAPERQKIRTQMREMMALHVVGDPGKEQLRQGYQDLKAARDDLRKVRDKILTDQLSSVLNDDQKNKLLELQANSER